MSVTINQTSFSKYRVQFVGRGGRVLHEAVDSPA